ncbi:hypothetical protein ACGF12_35830 [Kitasatospora sp. NPDC048296]|uniref:hypothetical protein n=1 Tax=Kitasatospora sp. NPDC048296 TaxID=3364048 RepID=UPI003722C63F
MTDAPQVDVPGVGGVKKTYVIAATAAAGGYVLYAYMKRARDRKASAAAASAAPNSDYGTPDVLPVVPPGAPGGFGNVNGSTTTPPPVGAITDNASWSAAVRDRMAGAYPDNVVVDAIGAFLNKQPLNDTQMRVVQAAIAVAGYPPVGDLHIITGGGNVQMLVAPSGFSVTNVTQSGYLIVWNPVPGAASYRIYESGVHTADNINPNCDVHNRNPGESASFEVSAVSATGQEGPKGGPVTFRTADAPAPAPQPAPAPAPAPQPAPSQPAPAPTPSQPAYPTYWTSHTNQHGDSYSSIAQQYGLNISGDELYQYQFSGEAGRPASTQAVLRQRGYLLYAGGETEIPYPRR